MNDLSIGRREGSEQGTRNTSKKVLALILKAMKSLAMNKDHQLTLDLLHEAASVTETWMADVEQELQRHGVLLLPKEPRADPPQGHSPSCLLMAIPRMLQTYPKPYRTSETAILPRRAGVLADVYVVISGHLTAMEEEINKLERGVQGERGRRRKRKKRTRPPEQAAYPSAAREVRETLVLEETLHKSESDSTRYQSSVQIIHNGSGASSVHTTAGREDGQPKSDLDANTKPLAEVEQHRPQHGEGSVSTKDSSSKRSLQSRSSKSKRPSADDHGVSSRTEGGMANSSASNIRAPRSSGSKTPTSEATQQQSSRRSTPREKYHTPGSEHAEKGHSRSSASSRTRHSMSRAASIAQDQSGGRGSTTSSHSSSKIDLSGVRKPPLPKKCHHPPSQVSGCPSDAWSCEVVTDEENGGLQLDPEHVHQRAGGCS